MLNIDRTAEKAFRIGAWHEIAEIFFGGGKFMTGKLRCLKNTVVFAIFKRKGVWVIPDSETVILCLFF